MAIKPIESVDKTLVLKIILVSGLIVAAIFLNKFYSDKSKKPANASASAGKEILGKETVENIQKSLPKNIEEAVKNTEEAAGNVLGQVTNLVTNTASKSAETISNIIIDNTVGSLMKQMDKLPDRQKEEIKNIICK